MIENLQLICFVALAVSVVISFFYHVKNVGIWSALLWAIIPFRLRYLWPSGTEYDRLDDNIPEWISVMQTISLIGLVLVWIVPNKIFKG